MEWTVVLAAPARKSLKNVPVGDRKRILAAFGQMQHNPFEGDIRKLQGLPGFRCRVGDWRIFFEIVAERRHVVIPGVARPTSTTY